MKKRFLAMLLALVMMLSLVPVTALAETGTDEPTPDGNVAQIGETEYATLADAVAAANAGDGIEITAEGTYTLPNIPKNITIKGAEDLKDENGVPTVVFNCVGSGSIASVNGATFENVTMDFGTSAYHGFQHAGTINMKNCVLNGLFYSYGEMNFDGCTFNAPSTEYSMWCYAGDVSYTNCIVNCAGKFANVYNEGNDGGTPWKITATGCTFNSTKTNKAAFNVKETCGVKMLKYDVTISACTCNENFPKASSDASAQLYVISPLVQVDDRNLQAESTGIKVTLNGVEKYPVAEGGTSVVELEDVTDGDRETVFENVEGLSEDEQKSIVTTLVKGSVATTEEATNVAEVEGVETLAIQLTNVAAEKADDAVKVNSISFDVTPKSASGEAVTTPASAIKFRLPLTDDFTVYAKVVHAGDADRYLAVKDENGAKYCEVEATHFSLFTASPVNEIPPLTPDDQGVYHITNEAGWAEFAAAVNGGNDFYDYENDAPVKVVLDANLDFSTEANAEYFVPVGASVAEWVQYDEDWGVYEYTVNYFNGEFDGANGASGNHTVKLALTVGNTGTPAETDMDVQDVALFGFVGENGTVKNLTTEGTVTGGYNASEFAAICAWNEGRLVDCVNKANVTGQSVPYVEEGETYYAAANTFGGVCAHNEGYIINCTNIGEVTGAAGCSYFNGVCGDNYGVIRILVGDKLVAVYTDKALDTDATVALVGEDLAYDIDNWCNISGVELSDTGLAAIIAEAIENSTTVADEDELDVLVRVKVTPTVFDSDADAGFAEIQYTLEPIAYVYANEGYFDYEYETYVNEYNPDAEIAITDELKEQPISLTFYTGFMPETVKVGSETFTGTAIEWQWWPPMGIYIDGDPFCTVTANQLGTVVASMGTRPVAEVTVGTTTTKYGTVDAAFAAAAAVESGSVTITVYDAAELDNKNYEFKCDTTINGDLSMDSSSIKAAKLTINSTNTRMTVDSSIETTEYLAINLNSNAGLIFDVTGATEDEYELIKHGGYYYGAYPAIDADTNTDEKYVADNFSGTAYGIKLNPAIYEPVAKVEYSDSTPNKEFVDLHAALEAGKAAGSVVTLLNNVDLAGKTWTPIENFQGTFDGAHKYINNLSGANGLFASLDGATVQDLTFDKVNISGGSVIGALAGTAKNSKIIDVAMTNSTISGVKRVGGLIGQITGNTEVTGSSVTGGSVTGSDSNTGGLIGEIAGGTTTLYGLHNSASVTNTEASISRAGGLVGQITGGANVTFELCSNTGTITTNTTGAGYAGGYVSAIQGKSTVTFRNTNVSYDSDEVLNGTSTGRLVAWICDGGEINVYHSLQIGSDGKMNLVNMIGKIDDAQFYVFHTDDEEYLYRGVASGAEFNDLWSGRKVLNQAYIDRIIAFYAYAATINPAFERYPGTQADLFISAWNTNDSSKKSTLYGTEWATNLGQYNTAKSDNMTAEDFAVTWNAGTLYYVDEAVARVTTAGGVTTDYADLHDALVAGKDAGSVVTLLKDVDIKGIEWAPVGAGTRSGSSYTGDSFKGTFDGNYHKIDGLKITKTNGADYSIGLIGILDGGTVKNLILDNVDIKNSTSEMAGAAVGMMVNGATVDNVTVNGSIAVKRGVGGIVGRMTISGTIKDCVNNATISGTAANVAGIVGAAYYNASGKTMQIINCTNNGTITGTAGFVGGIAGLSCADVSGCTNTAAITAKGASVGGIIGEQQNAGSVKNCENRGKVTNSSNTYGTGGIIGWVRYSGDASAYPVKEIIEVSGNTNSGSVESNGNGAGGIVGIVYNQASVTGNTNTAYSIKAGLWAAGIVGGYQANMGSNTVIGDGKLVITGNSTNTIPDADHMSMNQYSPVVYDNTQKIDWSDNIYPVAKTITDNGALVSVFYNNDVMTELASLGNKHVVELLWNVDGTYTLADEDEVLRVKHNGKTLKVEAPEGYELKNPVVNGVTTYSAEKKPVAQIGDVKYATLAAAIAAVPTDGTKTTIVMIADETIEGNVGVTVAATQNIVLDLNGKTVKNAVNENKGSQVITNKGTLTIRDSSNPSTGKITNAVQEGTEPGEWWSTPQYNYATNVITNSGTLNVKSGEIYETAAGSICYAIDNNSSAADAILNVSGGYIHTVSGTAIRQFCNSTTKTNDVTVSGGKIEAGYAGIWIQLPGSGAQKKLATLTVTGGELKGDYAFYDYSYGDLYDEVRYTLSSGTFDGAIFSYGANIAITGGTYNGEVAIKQAKASNVSVTGGKFTNVYTYGDNASEDFISGGYYTSDVSDYVAPGYECIALSNESTGADKEAFNEDYKYKVSSRVVTDGNMEVQIESESEQKDATISGNIPEGTAMNAANEIIGKINGSAQGSNKSEVVDLTATVGNYLNDLDMAKVKALAKQKGKETALDNLITTAETAAKDDGKDVEVTMTMTTDVKVEVTKVTVETVEETTKVTTFALDITPIYTLKVVSEIKSTESEQPTEQTVEIVTDEPLDVPETTIVTFPAPTGFVYTEGMGLFVNHNKAGGVTYTYPATYDKSTKMVSFTNPHGFSEFELVTTTVANAVAKNVQEDKYYTTLTTALSEAEANQTVTLLKNIGGEGNAPAENFVVVETGVTLDLNGYSITGAKFIYVTGSMIDSVALDARGSISATGYMFDPDTQKYTPVYDASADGYRLFNLKFSDSNTKVSASTGNLVFTLGPSNNERNAAYALLTANTKYNNRFKVVITFNWSTENETIEQSFNYKQEFIDQVMESNGGTVFSAAITGLTGTATAQPKYVICDAAGNAMYTLTGYTFTTTDGGTTWTRN